MEDLSIIHQSLLKLTDDLRGQMERAMDDAMNEKDDFFGPLLANAGIQPFNRDTNPDTEIETFTGIAYEIIRESYAVFMDLVELNLTKTIITMVGGDTYKEYQMGLPTKIKQAKPINVDGKFHVQYSPRRDEIYVFHNSTGIQLFALVDDDYSQMTERQMYDMVLRDHHDILVDMITTIEAKDERPHR